MSLEALKLIHLIGLFTVILSLGGMCLHVINGGTRNYPARKMMAITHGIGWLIALVGSLGLLIMENIAHPLPHWAMGKFVMFLFLGAAPALIYRKTNLAKVWWWSILGSVLIALYLVMFKPF